MKWNKAIIVSIFLAVLVSTTLHIYGADPGEPHPGNAVWLEPSTVNLTDRDVGYKFNVTLWINLTDVPDPGSKIGAWQTAIVYNKTLLNFTRYDFTARVGPEYPSAGAKISEWFKKAGTWKTMPKFDRGSFNDTHNYLLPGETWSPPDVGEPDNPMAPEGSYGSLIWIEFQLLDKPTPPYVDYIQFITAGVRRCKILDESNTDVSGTFSFYPAECTFGGAPPPALNVNVTPPAASLQVGQAQTFTAAVSGGVSPYTVVWINHTTGDQIGTGSTYTYTALAEGTYKIFARATDQTATTADSPLVTITVSALPPVGAILYVDPAEIVDPTMLPSSTFRVNITINNVANMKACVFNLTYKPDIIGWIGMNLFKVQDQIPTSKIFVDDEAGFIWTKLTYPSSITVTQPTPLANIQFHVEAIGATPLDLHDTQLLDPQNNPMPHEAKDGYFATLIRDLTITNVTPSRNWVYQGWEVNITATVKNNGNQNETFWLAVYYNNDIIANYTVENLPPNNETTRIFTWDTENVPFCKNYTIKAKVPVLPYETNTADNEYIDGYIKVRIFADVNGDGIVDIADIYLIALSFGTYPWDERWNPDADLNRDGIIDITDIYLTALNYGKRCP